ncbi:MAG: hypothetical protein EYC62_00010 [Alphaproteobacteria bacterium]|nr:MAG: hypothetical protein EYC62_00010 [Alphaproteobacteria bacterium]
MWFDAAKRQHRYTVDKPAVIEYDDQGKPTLQKYYWKGRLYRLEELDPDTGRIMRSIEQPDDRAAKRISRARVDDIVANYLKWIYWGRKKVK